MSIARLQHCAPFLLFAILVASCSTDPEANPNHGAEKCKGDPYRGFCIAKSSTGGADHDASSDEVGMLGDGGHGHSDAGKMDGGGTDGDGGADSGLPSDASFDDAGMLLPPPDVKEGAECEGMTFESCYLGPEGTEGKGGCKEGTRLCECESGEETCDQRKWGPCVGQVLPSIETCNAIDDDCDDEIDEDLDLGSCAVPDQFGACEAGVQRCTEGMGVVTCEPVANASPEVCNGINDDCDMETDEDTTVLCYDDAMPGCTPNASGGFDCFGLCAPGTRTCDNAELGACQNAVEPVDEVCTGVGGTAANEDCDEITDEDCDCNDGDSHPCYGGPDGTEDTEICHAGLQTCTDHQFGDCEGEQRPEVETCANDGTNDDCDGDVDEVESRGEPCSVMSNNGRCRNGVRTCVGDDLDCVTLEPVDEECNSQDDDCDTKVDEAFDLDSDPDNCGECGHQCTGGTSCCAGVCANLQNDRNHCGACPNQCGGGLTCCSAHCVNTSNDESNCNTCGHGCPLLNSCVGGACRLL